MWKSPTDISSSRMDGSSGPGTDRFGSDSTSPRSTLEHSARLSNPDFTIARPTPLENIADKPVPPPMKRGGSRWGNNFDSTHTPPKTLLGPPRLDTPQSLDNHAIRLRLEEIDRKLSLISCEQATKGTSPRDSKPDFRKILEDEKLSVVAASMKATNNAQCLAPIANLPRRAARPFEKVYIPVKEFPDINFFGLLVGPRGNSLKRMERESGAKISIRGKGSIKEGKPRLDHSEDAEEDLHCLVTADIEEKVALCVKMINKVIETAASTPEGQNDHKRNQLRELAALNGTLRDDEHQNCQNCGGTGHRKFDCPEQRPYTAQILCRVCNQPGHIARDCVAHRSIKPSSSAPPLNVVHAPRNAGVGSFNFGMADFGEGIGRSATTAPYNADLLPYPSKTTAWTQDSIWAVPPRIETPLKVPDALSANKTFPPAQQRSFENPHAHVWNTLPNNTYLSNAQAQSQEPSFYFTGSPLFDAHCTSNQLNDSQ